MRNHERIDRIGDKLIEAWKLVPDWRLGQLVSNLLGSRTRDVFHLEDDEWEERIDAFIDRYKPKKP